MKRSYPGSYARNTKRRKLLYTAVVASNSRNPPLRARRGYSTVSRTRGVYASGEMKYFDTAYAGNIVSVTSYVGTVSDPTALCLLAPTVGAGINQRIGKAVKAVKIKIRGTVTIPPYEGDATALTSNLVRLILVQDQQTNSTQMDGNQLMSAVASSPLIPLSFQNIDNFGRFKVLKDKTILIDDPNLGGSDTNHDSNGLTRQFKFSYKFKFPVQVRFNATNGGTVADIVDNSFHMIANRSGGNDTPLPVLNYACRFCYKE